MLGHDVHGLDKGRASHRRVSGSLPRLAGGVVVLGAVVGLAGVCAARACSQGASDSRSWRCGVVQAGRARHECPAARVARSRW